EREKRRKQKDLIKQEISQYQKEREDYLKAEKQKLSDELEAIHAYTAKKDDEQNAAKAAIKARQEQIEKLQDELGKELLRKEKERQELEDIRQTLILEENAKKAREEEENLWIKKLTNQQKLQADYEKQLALKDKQKEVRQ
ncbi:unnamed protein product, partial [Trichobilharzia regenti]